MSKKEEGMSKSGEAVSEKEKLRQSKVEVARPQLRTADRNRLKKVIGTGVYKYIKESLKLDPKNLDDELVSITKKGKREARISKFQRRFEQLELNDEDILSLLSIMLSKKQMKDLKTAPYFSEGVKLPRSKYDEITRYLNQNATQAVGQTLRSTLNFIVTNPLATVRADFGKLGLTPPLPTGERPKRSKEAEEEDPLKRLGIEVEEFEIEEEEPESEGGIPPAPPIVPLEMFLPDVPQEEKDAMLKILTDYLIRRNVDEDTVKGFKDVYYDANKKIMIDESLKKGGSQVIQSVRQNFEDVIKGIQAGVALKKGKTSKGKGGKVGMAGLIDELRNRNATALAGTGRVEKSPEELAKQKREAEMRMARQQLQRVQGNLKKQLEDLQKINVELLDAPQREEARKTQEQLLEQIKKAGEQIKKAEGEQVEVEVPVEADPSGRKKITTKRIPPPLPVGLPPPLLTPAEREAMDKIRNEARQDKALQEKLKSQNQFIQNQLQSKFPKVVGSITPEQRSRIANVIQTKSLLSKYQNIPVAGRSLAKQSIMEVTGKSISQLEREEPLLGTAKRMVGMTGAGSISAEEEESAEDYIRTLLRVDSDSESVASEIYGKPAGVPPPSAPTAEEAEKAEAEKAEAERPPPTSPEAEVSTALTVPSAPTAGVTTTPVELPKKLTDEEQNETAKGTQRPKFISPSVNVLQPSEQDIQADFDEWAIFDFVQPVNNYGAEGNLNNNPLKRMARVEEETRFRNAGIDLQPALSSVYTNREVNDNQSQMALDMLPPLMPDTSKYEVKSYDVNNDRTAIEYQSPYDNMTPIVLTNDEIRRSVLYGRVP
jgi:hypothetical protein